jgi:hypothetical protein
MRALALGDVVHHGDVILTTQDGIVQISDSDGESRVATRLPEDDLDKVIQAINDGDGPAAPAAISGGGGDGAMSAGYRVARIVEGLDATIDLVHTTGAP